MLNRLRGRRGADRLRERGALRAVIGEHPDLDELVTFQVRFDFTFDFRRQACVADHHDGLQMVRAGAQHAAFAGREL